MKKIFSSIAILAVSTACFTACFNLDEVAYSEILQESFEPTDAEPTVRIGVNGLVEKFEAARNNWDDVKYFLQMIEKAS